MKIKICDANENKIGEALDKANGRAESFTIRFFSDVASYAADAEKLLESSKLAKSERRGAIAMITPAGPSAKAYKYSAKSTKLVMLRGAKDWFLTDVKTVEVYPRQNERVNITISAEQAEIIQAKAIAEFNVVERKPTAEYQPYSECVEAPIYM